MSRKHALIALILLGAMVGLASCNRLGEQQLYPLKLIDPIEISQWCPDEGEQGVSVDTAIWVTFDGPIDVTSLTRNSILLGSGREHIRGHIKYSEDLQAVQYIPYEELLPNNRYDFYVTEDVRDIYGRLIMEEFKVITFMTGDPGSIICPQDPRDPIIGRELEEESELEWESESESDGDVEVAEDLCGEDEECEILESVENGE